MGEIREIDGWFLRLGLRAASFVCLCVCASVCKSERERRPEQQIKIFIFCFFVDNCQRRSVAEEWCVVGLIHVC